MQEIVFSSNYANFVLFSLDENSLDNINTLLEQSTLLQNYAKRYAAKPLVVDLSACQNVPAGKKLKALWQAFEKRGLTLVGIIHPKATPAHVEKTNLSLIYPLGDENAELLPEGLAPLQSAPPVSVESQSTLPTSDRATMLIQRPIRSGQSVYAKNADLVVIGMVNSGAEIIADGNISVFGELRGRAFAGAKGDTNAFIYCHKISEEVEMLSIAHIFKTSHQFENKGFAKSNLVQLIDEELIFTTIR